MTRQRTTLAGLLLVALAFAALIGVSLTNAVVYYRTPSELRSSPTLDVVRLFGLVVPGSVSFDRDRGLLSFRLTDGVTEVAVVTNAVPTALFRDGVGVVVAGRMDALGVFLADEILVKHSEVYEPLKPGQTIPPGLLDSLASAAP